MTFSPRNTPSQPVTVEYDLRGGRAVREFANHVKARTFFTKKLKDRKRPQILSAGIIPGITGEEYREEYRPVHEKENGTDPHDRFDVEFLLRELRGHDLRSHDGYTYRIDRQGRVQSTSGGDEEGHLGASTWAGLIGWVMKPEQAVDLLEQLEYFVEMDGTHGVDRALEICGFAM